MKTILSFATALCCASILSACTAGLENDTENTLGEPSENALEGKVAGTPWNFQSGVFRQDVQNADRYSYRLYESQPTGDICNYTPPPAEQYIQFSVPKLIGSYPLGVDSQVAIAFVKPGNNLEVHIATEGSIVIQLVTETSAIGKLNALVDEGNSANGKFAVSFCP